MGYKLEEMKDVSYPLRKAYVAALAGITYEDTPVGVYYPEIPDNMDPEVAIVLSSINSNDRSTKGSADTSTSIQVTIRTFNEKYNNGRAADTVGGEVLARIYPNKQFDLDLSADGLQVTNTELQQDFLQDYGVQNDRKYIDRIMVFRHDIYHIQGV